MAKENRFRFYAFKLSLIIVIVFFLQTFVKGFTELFVLNSNAWIQVWRFFTALFLHGGLGHLAYNLFALLLFGSILEKLIGGKRFLLIFFATGIIANIISVNFYDSSLGASGAIFGVIGALIIVRSLLTVWAFGMPMPIFVAGILWMAGDFIGAYGFFTGNPLNNTGNIAHLTGILFGFIFGAFFRDWSYRKGKSERYEFDENSMRNWEDYFMRN